MLKSPVAATMVLLIVAVCGLVTAPVRKEKPSPELPEEYIAPRVEPTKTSFKVSESGNFTLKFESGLDSDVETYEVRNEALEWSASLSRQELEAGARLQVPTKKAGIFDIQITAAGRGVNSFPVAVESAELRVRREIVWTLKAEEPLFSGESLVVPVRVIAQTPSGLSEPQLVPASLTETTRLTLTADNSQISSQQVVVRQGNAVSDGVLFPLRRDMEYKLTASTGEGEVSNSLRIAWDEFNPDVALVVDPVSQEQYATQLTPALVRVYLTYSGRLLKPTKPLEVRAANSPLITLPVRQFELSPDNPQTEILAFSSSTINAGEVSFSQVDLGAEGKALIVFKYPWGFILIATVGGIFGVLMAQRQNLFKGSLAQAAFEILASIGGAFLLYCSFILGWLPHPDVVLGSLPAACIGIVGGFSGEGIFKLLAKVLTGWGKVF